MKRNSWIWTLTVLLTVVFFAMCAVIAYAADADAQYALENRESLAEEEEAETREGIGDSGRVPKRSTIFMIIGALGAVLLVLTMAIFSILNKNKKEQLYKNQNSCVAF